jgi:dTDP-4-dehydrorhamnose 3,5-epimerase
LIFSPTTVPGAFVIQPERIPDGRGFFARTYCVREFEEHGLDPRVVQRSQSYNRRRATLRGMHFQIAPHLENKVVTCTQGAIYDVILDLRPDSPGYRTWFGITLMARDGQALYVPMGCAHGFVTLDDDTTVNYDISEYYQPDSARGLRYDDPAFAIKWPVAPVVISPRDLAFPPYQG